MHQQRYRGDYRCAPLEGLDELGLANFAEPEASKPTALEAFDSIHPCSQPSRSDSSSPRLYLGLLVARSTTCALIISNEEGLTPRFVAVRPARLRP